MGQTNLSYLPVNMATLQLLLCLALVASSLGCSYWCKTPEGSVYCCQEGASNPNAPINSGGGFGGFGHIGSRDDARDVHPGNCPIVRRQCPNTRFGLPPRKCAYDGACLKSEKCCFDRCLNEHVCKGIVGGFGGFGGFGHGHGHGGFQG